MSHAVDLARWFLGEFAEVTAFTQTQFWNIRPLEDNAFALYRTRKGAVASIHSSLTQWKNVFSFDVYAAAGVNSLRFASVGSNDSLGGSLDSVSLTVPEPGALGLAAFAVFGVWACRRRRA